jgi:uncharacterized membrane protein
VFSNIFGIPAHPLFVHATVVFVPLLALFTVLYALVPRGREKIGWAVAALAIITPIAALCTKLAGDNLINRVFPRGAPPNVFQHREYGTILCWVTFGLGIAAGLLLWVFKWRKHEDHPGWLRVGSQLLGLAMAAIATYYVIRTGDSGARSVWGFL